MNLVDRTDLVVAGTGFVGSYVLAGAHRAGISALGIDIAQHGLAQLLAPDCGPEIACDLRDAVTVAGLIATSGAQTLVMAARTAPDDHPSLAEALIRAAIEGGIRRIVLVSSLAVYGQARPRRDARGLTEALAPATPSAYGIAKLREELLVRDAAQRAGIELVILRSSGLFGRLPAPRSGPGSAAVIDRLLRRYVAGGNPVLDVEDVADQYLYAGDLAACVLAASRSAPPHEVINVGPGRSLSPSEVQSDLEAALGTSVDLDVTCPASPATATMDTTRLDAWLPCERRGDLVVGLRAAAADVARSA